MSISRGTRFRAGGRDVSREEDERQEERLIRNVRARVKRARAVVASTPGLAETLVSDRRKAERLDGRFGITEERFRERAVSTDPA